MSDLLSINLSGLDSRTAAAIREAPELPFATQTISRSGLPVTGLTVGGRERYFHSTYDPNREAQRLAQSVDQSTVICIGFGTGHQIAELRAMSDLVVLIEPDAAVIKYALTLVDLHQLLADQGVRLVTGVDAGNAVSILPEIYMPSVHGGATVVELPGRVASDPELFAGVREAVRSALDVISNDFAVQSHFGRLWLRNTLVNLAGFVSSSQNRREPAAYPDVARHVIVTAAGPSLEEHVAGLSPGDAAILATDTSLPALTARGVVPDAVVTVDSQVSGYHHYLTAGSGDTTLVADLAAPPALFSRMSRRTFLLSRHPLHHLLSRLGVRAVNYNPGSGTVTLGAVSVALALGAQSITVIGADFSYPRGVSYTRGSYVHRLFNVCSHRLQPASSRHFGFVQDRPGLYRDGTTLRLKVMDRYLDGLRETAAAASVPVVRVAPGEPVVTAGNGPGLPSAPEPSAPFVPPGIITDLLGLYRRAAEQQPATSAQMDPVLGATLPFVAWMQRRSPGHDPQLLLRQALDETITILEYLNQTL